MKFPKGTLGLNIVHGAQALISSADILKARILIVDDQAHYVALLEQILIEAGYVSVASTLDPREVYELHRKNRYDLILLDLNMAGMDGFQVMERLKEIETGGYLPILVVAGRAEHKLRALQVGARDFVGKPFDHAEVLIRVHNLIEVRLLQQKLLLHNSARLENSQRIAGIGDWEYDFVHQRLVWSEEVYRILGLDPRETPPNAESFYRRVHPADLAFVQREKAVAAQGSRRADIEHRIVRPDGEVRHVHQIAEMKFDEHGQPTREAGTIQDITARKVAEEALREAESEVRRQASFAQFSPNPLLELSATGEVNYCNAAAVALARLLDREHPRQILPAGTARIVGDCLATGKPMLPLETQVGDRTITWSFLPVPGSRTVHCYAVDITESRLLEKKFRHSQRLEAIGSLASGVAHDMNNILAPMLMASGVLRDKLPAESDRNILALVENGALRGAAIIRQLLAFSSGVEGARTSVQLRHVLREMKHLVQETFPRNIRIEENIAKDLWTVVADATQMHQVFLNLCVNARDAMPEGGLLTMSAENFQLTEAQAGFFPDAKPGPYVKVTVADNGSGIAPEVIPRIFDPFFTTKGIGKGTGLGLSTASGIVKSHGGFITASSEPGRITSFQVYLPATDGAESVKRAEPGEPVAQGNGELILVVDDEAPILVATCKILTDCGYRVITAGNGEEAIRQFMERSDAVDLVLTDLLMPGGGGVEFIRALRIVKADVKVIVTSGLAPEGKRSEFAALGVTEILPKPCLGEALIQAVQRTLARKPLVLASPA
jgi:PAS domain S-box-containing protein